MSDNSDIHSKEGGSVKPVRSTAKPQCLLVLGMHRSGTSALARLLALAGAKLPRRLMAAGPGNEKGHWEPQVLVTYFDQLLAEAGSSWHDWEGPDLSRLPPGRKDAVKREITDIIVVDYPGASLFVVKDPRICRLAPLFIGALEQAGYQVSPILVFRNPLDVMRSLEVREEFWPEGYTRVDAAMLWLRHVLDAEKATRGMRRAVVSYDSVLRDWRGALNLVAEQTGCDFPFQNDEIETQVGEFLTNKSRHHKHTTEELLLDSDLRGWVSDAYEALRVLERTPTSERATAEFDSISASLERTSPALVAFAKAGRAARAAALEKAQASIDALRREQSDRQGKLEREVADTQTRLTQALELETLRVAEVQDLRVELQSVREALYKCSDEFSQAKEQHEAAYNDALLKLASSLHVLRSHAGALREAAEARENLIDDVVRSTSWKISRPARALKHIFKGSRTVWHRPEIPPPVHVADVSALMPSAPLATSSVVDKPAPVITYFTICSRNFMAYARTLHTSLSRYYPGVRFFVALCDDDAPSPPFDPANEPFEFIGLDDLNLPEWREMSRRYNITEFNTAIKPFVFQYLFDKTGAENVIYFDPDIYVVDRLVELEDAFRLGATAILTPHMLEPAPDAEMNEKRLLQYGIYNLGFLGVRNTPASRRLIDWWGRRLKTDCIIKRDEGLFVDQKWADHFPAFLPGTLVLHHPGYNVAYWNLSSRKVTWTGSAWEVNGRPLRFVHFSGNDLDNPECLSRHSSEHTTYTIGALKDLLDEYRRRIFEEGHEAYRWIPYAFSWEGVAGVNEHTPRPKFQQGAGGATAAAAEQTPAASYAPVAGTPVTLSAHTTQGPVSSVDLLRTAVRMAGGPGNLAKKTAKALRTGGLGQVKSRIDYVRRRTENQAVVAATPVGGRPDVLSWRKKALFIEWATPRPNQDSGSRTAFYFIEILTLLGYDVTFLPADMLHAGRYTRDLEDIGVTCVHGGIAGSVEAYLREAGVRFDFVVLNRVHVVAPLLGHIETYCPQAKIIFNTVDLHYVRELRDAELAGAPIDEALETKRAELGLVDAAEETIVLSYVERDELRQQRPDAKVCVLPLVFSDIDPKPPAHGARKDILFIGSFPHKPNVDAVLAFARDVFPKLRAKRPDIAWHIVGSAPTEEVLALANEPGIFVHGFVDDLSPLFRSVRLSIAPLRFGAGIKGKIATSLSYGVPVVASPIAVEGMELAEGDQVCVAHDPDHWVDTIVALYDDEARWSRMSESGQALTVAQYSVSANALRVAEVMRRVDPDLGDMELFRFTSKREHDYLRSSFPEVVSARLSRELALLPPNEDAFNVEGYCATCGAPHSFLTSFMYACEKHASGRAVPNWREHLACDSCGFTMRLRAAMHFFFVRAYPGADASLYITEQATPLFDWLKARHPNLTGSEYLGDKCAFGQEAGGYRNEDLTRLTFADNSFDAILSFDVLEHVADDLAAFRECYRCLKPGGVLFFTAPFAFDKQDKVIRAELRPDGTINHIMPPEIHGNPVDPDGALCFRYFGWDVLDDLKSVGFTSTEVLNYWSTSFAYLGKFGYVVVARKGMPRG